MYELYRVSHHPAEFGGQRHCGSGDIMALVCHVELFKFEMTAYDHGKTISPGQARSQEFLKAGEVSAN